MTRISAVAAIADMPAPASEVPGSDDALDRALDRWRGGHCTTAKVTGYRSSHRALQLAEPDTTNPSIHVAYFGESHVIITVSFCVPVAILVS